MIFRRELRDTVFSRRFQIYILLFFLPVVLFSWFYKVISDDPTMLIRISALYPEPLTSLAPTIAMMFFVCTIAGMAVTLVAIIHAGDFIAGEQSRGTLLLLSSKPIRRWEILLAKYLSFLAAFIPLLFLSLLSIYYVIPALGLGWVPSKTFLGYFSLMLAMGTVYASISTLFSSMTNDKLKAILGALIFMMIWFTFDFIMVYLPDKTADFLGTFSVSYHANTISNYISGGGATLRMMHVAVDNSFQTFIRSSVILTLFTVVPLLAAIKILANKDIHGR